jgi:phage terminase small subunit
MSEADAAPQLDPQYQLFIEKYFELGFNQTKAAIAAGYSKKSARNQAYRLMKNDDIRKAIELRFSELVISKNEVLVRLVAHASGDMGDFANVKSARTLANHPNSNLIKKFKRTITTTTTGKDAAKETTTEERIELELYDAQGALVQLGRYHSLFTDKTDLTSGGDKLTAPIVFLPAVEPDEP